MVAAAIGVHKKKWGALQSIGAVLIKGEGMFLCFVKGKSGQIDGKKVDFKTKSYGQIKEVELSVKVPYKFSPLCTIMADFLTYILFI